MCGFFSGINSPKKGGKNKNKLREIDSHFFLLVCVEVMYYASLVGLLLFSAYATSQTCVDTPGCNGDFNLRPELLCNAANKVCVVYPQHCSGLARILATGIIQSGWTILVNTDTQVTCSLANPENCANVALIQNFPSQAPPSPPRICLPLGTRITGNNVTITSTRGAILVPPERKTFCTGLVVSGSGFTLSNVGIDMVNCAVKSLAILITGSSSKVSFLYLLLKEPPIDTACPVQQLNGLCFNWRFGVRRRYYSERHYCLRRCPQLARRPFHACFVPRPGCSRQGRQQRDKYTTFFGDDIWNGNFFFFLF